MEAAEQSLLLPQPSLEQAGGAPPAHSPQPRSPGAAESAEIKQPQDCRQRQQVDTDATGAVGGGSAQYMPWWRNVGASSAGVRAQPTESDRESLTSHVSEATHADSDRDWDSNVERHEQQGWCAEDEGTEDEQRQDDGGFQSDTESCSTRGDSSVEDGQHDADEQQSEGQGSPTITARGLHGAHPPMQTVMYNAAKGDSGEGSKGSGSRGEDYRLCIFTSRKLGFGGTSAKARPRPFALPFPLGGSGIETCAGGGRMEAI